MKLNPVKSNQQASFRKIYPGTTSENTVLQILGKPTIIFPVIKEISDDNDIGWLYDNQPQNVIGVNLVGNIVESIEVENYEAIPSLEDIVSLSDIVKVYGCPDIIVALDTGEEPSGIYYWVVFCYAQIGVEFWFEYNNVKLTNFPSEIKYFKPIEIDDYLEFYSILFNSQAMKPVYWDEVLTED